MAGGTLRLQPRALHRRAPTRTCNNRCNARSRTRCGREGNRPEAAPRLPRLAWRSSTRTPSLCQPPAGCVQRRRLKQQQTVQSCEPTAKMEPAHRSKTGRDSSREGHVCSASPGPGRPAAGCCSNSSLVAGLKFWLVDIVTDVRLYASHQ